MENDRHLPQKDKSHHIKLIPWLLMWCGEGDLNPHEIAPASTSSGFLVFWSGPDHRTC